MVNNIFHRFIAPP